MSTTVGSKEAVQFTMRRGDFLDVSGSGLVTINFTGFQKRIRILPTSQVIGAFETDGDCTIVADDEPAVFSVSRERETQGSLPVTYDPDSASLIAGGQVVSVGGGGGSGNTYFPSGWL